MWTSNPPDGAPGPSRHGTLRDVWLRLRALAVALLLALVLPVEAQVARAQRAIEDLEKCGKEERKAGCVEILKVESGKGGKQAIKAQVRGGRIIWYEYESKTGRVRRTN